MLLIQKNSHSLLNILGYFIELEVLWFLSCMPSNMSFLLHRGQKEVAREERPKELILEKLQKCRTSHLSQLDLTVRYKVNEMQS